ncbi:DUF2608 domain-containing protein [Candidatus Odyssella thessalonicensis]|uniref:DUF2608 domain-containing protein n=1 Tax=Candidatus Odyssella thessalonicensis TaxID=84647 RepID=UPI000225B19F|nr:DUF2608 domain-containing protein [Candidatus Odyssella thessalonicensis]
MSISIHKLLIILFFCNLCFADIIQTSDIKCIETTLQSADQDTLVIFDIDDVLLFPKDQILRSENRKYLKELSSRLERLVGEEEAQLLYSIIFEQRQNGPVDPKMRDLISNLQSQGIKVLALTNCFTGAFGKIKSLEEWRCHELHKHGYHFDQSWPALKAKQFHDLNKQENGLSTKNNSIPMFIRGTVFTSSVSKGKALQAFLKYAQLSPKRIIFIDDKERHLKSVQRVALAHNISFTGIKYTAADDLAREALNKQRAELQFEVLKKDKKWMADSEASTVEASKSILK